MDRALCATHYRSLNTIGDEGCLTDQGLPERSAVKLDQDLYPAYLVPAGS